MIPKTYLASKSSNFRIDIVEVGEYYTETIFAARSRSRCTLEEAKKEARDAGYQVIADLCTIVHTIDGAHIIVAVEPEVEPENLISAE